MDRPNNLIINNSFQAKSNFSGNQLDSILRFIIEKKFKLIKIDDIENKELSFYQIELFDNKKNLLDIDYFEENKKFYYIKKESEYFYIDKDDLTKLFYYDEKSKTNKIIICSEDDEFQKEEKKDDSPEEEMEKHDRMENQLLNESEEVFIDEIKLNLISDKTISFYGKNNNIPQKYLQGYKTKEKNNYLLSYGNDINIKSNKGKYHYIMDNYFIKFTSIKELYDNIYKNSEKEINLDDFKSKVIFKNFDFIPKNKIILFEFKNEIYEEKNLIQHVKRYQSLAKLVTKEKDIYHIIILTKCILENEILNYIDNNKSLIDELNKFAIICLDDQSEIYGEAISISFSDESQKSSKSSKTYEDDESKLNLQYFLDYMKKNLDKINDSLNDLKISTKIIIEKLSNNNILNFI